MILGNCIFYLLKGLNILKSNTPHSYRLPVSKKNIFGARGVEGYGEIFHVQSMKHQIWAAMQRPVSKLAVVVFLHRQPPKQPQYSIVFIMGAQKDTLILGNP